MTTHVVANDAFQGASIDGKPRARRDLPRVDAGQRNISCLGRLEPIGGVRHVASPSIGGGVIATLEVEEGQWVEEGAVLATLTEHVLRRAEVTRIEAELANAKREVARARRLSKNSATSAARLDEAELAVRVARADLSAAKARVELTRVRAPISGQVLEIHARPGERVQSEGILEIGETSQMVAIAEVYETDILAVQQGQRARITSPALSTAIGGVVGGIGLKVGRIDVLGTDPIAKTDARVVEVRIDLDSSDEVRSLTNLQVEVEIDR